VGGCVGQRPQSVGGALPVHVSVRAGGTGIPPRASRGVLRGWGAVVKRWQRIRPCCATERRAARL